MIKKPTVVLIPGAFAKSSCFDALVPYLQDAGYSTVVVAIPSSDPLDPSNATCQKDYDHVRDDILLPLIDGEGTDVLLFIHSYGGQLCPTGLSKAQRQSEGKKGGVIGLVYLAGNVVHEGASLLQFCGGQWPSVVKLDTPHQDLAVISPVIEVLYNDMDTSKHAELEATMTPHAYSAFTTPAAAPAWAESFYDGRRMFLRALQDNLFPPAFVNQYLADSGVQWKVVDVDGSHGALVSKPKEVASRVMECAEEWASG